MEIQLIGFVLFVCICVNKYEQVKPGLNQSMTTTQEHYLGTTY